MVQKKALLANLQMELLIVAVAVAVLLEKMSLLEKQLMKMA
jgi:hypothetical protein